MMHSTASGARNRKRTVWVSPEERMVRTARGGRLERMAGFNILNLRGSPYEMGLQHGLLLRSEIHDGIFDFYVNYLARILENALKRRSLSILDYIKKFMQRSVFAGRMFAKLARSAPKNVLEEIHGLSDGAGVPMERLLRGYCMCDTLLYIIGRVFTTRRRLAPALMSACYPLASACTSVAAWGSVTADGRMLHGRNLEFMGSGIWDRHPTVIRFEPTDGMRYVSVTTAGVGTGGVTCANEAGLTLALHINTTRDVSLDGMPMIWLVDQIVRNATSLDEAVRIAARHPAACGFTIIMTDAKNRRAGALEFSAGRQTLREGEAGRLVQTNHYLDPGQQDAELEVNTSIRAQTLGRFNRAQELVDAGSGTMDVRQMIDLLSDHHDPYLMRDRFLGNTISQPHNISSVVFEPEASRVWVAVGPAPTCHGKYYCVSYAPDHAWDNWLHYYNGNGMTDPVHAKAFQCYMAAYRKATLGAAPSAICADLEEACRLDSREPAYPYACGVYHLKLKRFLPAIERFEQAKAFANLPHKHMALRFWKGVALLGLGRPGDAQVEFAAVKASAGAGQEMKAMAEKGATGQLDLENLPFLEFDFVFTDVIDWS